MEHLFFEIFRILFKIFRKRKRDRKEKNRKFPETYIYAILRDVCVQVLSVMTMITTTLVCLARFHSFT